MALHGSDNRHLGVSPVGAAMTTGYSLDLPLDTVGIFSKDNRKTTRRGLKALANFAGIDKRSEKISILFGTKGDTGRHGSDKNSRTVDFSLADVKKVGIAHPKVTEQKVDYWRVGWDGLHDETSLKFHQGQTLEFQLTIGGIAATFFNDTACYTVRQLVSVPNIDGDFTCGDLVDGLCEPVDCKEQTIELVKGLNDHLLPGGQKLSQFFDIYPIFKAPASNGTPVPYKQWTLDYCGFGGDHELSKVSAQYPGVKVERDPFTNKFVIFAKAAYTPANYIETKESILKGCDECPDGYDEIPEGFVYAIALEDEGFDYSTQFDGTATIAKGDEAFVSEIPNVIEGSVLKTGQDFGIGHYVAVTSVELTEAQLESMIETNATQITKFVGTKAAFCANDATTTHAWVESGTCNASTAKYRIIVADDCNGNRLADLQDAYPELTITLLKSENCLSVYETTVETSLSCDEGCNSSIVEQVFTSEAPKPFAVNTYWFPVTTDVSATGSVCGFEIKAKPIVLNPSECTLDELPFVMTSTRIKGLSGGYPIDYSMNTIVPVGTWRVQELERAVDLDNLGGNLREWEQKGRFYFQDEKPYRSAVERSLTGTQSRLNGLTQYSDVFVTVEGSNKAGINNKEYTYITYHILVPYGRTTDIEGLFGNLAGAAGVPFEVK